MVRPSVLFTSLSLKDQGTTNYLTTFGHRIDWYVGDCTLGDVTAGLYNILGPPQHLDGTGVVLLCNGREVRNLIQSLCPDNVSVVDVHIPSVKRHLTPYPSPTLNAHWPIRMNTAPFSRATNCTIT